MYEVTTYDLMIFVVLGFGAGVFATYYLARLFEIVHLWRLVQQTLTHLLLMCVKILEDVAFLEEIKRQHMKDADFTPKQMRQFREVDEQVMTNWKDSVIMSMRAKAPPSFHALIPFKNWREAVEFMEKSLKNE